MEMRFPCKGVVATSHLKLGVITILLLLAPAVDAQATGVPSIAGMARVGETLTASVSEIADEDGLGEATFTYQWIRSDGTTDTEIADATQASYTLVSADQGKTIKVRTTFIDDGGTEETTKAVSVVTLDDTVGDGGETFTLRLSNASGATLADAETTGTIIDDDGSSSVAWDPITDMAIMLVDPNIRDGLEGLSDELQARRAHSYGLMGVGGSLAGVGVTAGEKVNFRTYSSAAAGIGSVRLELTGPQNISRTDNTAPYTLFEDIIGRSLPAGSYQLRATPYPEADLGGTPGTTHTASFTLVTDTTPPSVSVMCGDGTPDSDSRTEVNIEISEPVLGGFGRNDIEFNNIRLPRLWLVISSRLAFGWIYTFSVEPEPAGGETTITFPAGITTDEVGNPNTASEPLHIARNRKVSVGDASATEGTDAKVDFVVTLDARNDCETVTVDWTTVDGTATAGEDYTAASGTLTFGPGETGKTVRIAVLNDAEDDSGETFTLRLSNASGATLADAEATGTISDGESPVVSMLRIDGVPQVGNTLRVSFDEQQAASGKRRAASGALAYQWLRGSEVIAGATASTYVVTVADVGARLSVRVESGDGSITNAATAPVWSAPANPPLEDGEEELLSTTMTLGWHQFPLWVAGYGRVRGESFGEMDVTSFEDGGATYVIDAFLVNSRGVFGLATGSTRPDASGLVAYWNGYRISGLEAYTSNSGKSPPMLMGHTPQPSTEYSRYEGGASDGIRVAVSLRRAGPPDEPPPLTASFVDMPEAHDGERAFTFRIAFSEPLSLMNGRRLREDVVAVAGGRATAAGRVNRRRDLWQLTVEPDSPADVTVTLAAGAACGTPAAVCTKDGQALSETISATVAGPPASAPDQPTGLSATATHGSVTLTWDDPGDDSITGYVILRRVRVNDTGGDFDVLVADTGTAATTYTDNTVAASTTYTYRIKAINGAGTSERSRWFHIDTPAAPASKPAVADGPPGLAPNAPNPFNASTLIPYRLDVDGPVRLEIYNLLGQPVRTLVDQYQDAGFYKVRWDARDRRGALVSAGMYLVRLHYPGGMQTQRLLYLK